MAEDLSRGLLAPLPGGDGGGFQGERLKAEGGPSMIPPLKGAQGDVFGARQKVEGRRQNRRRIFHCTFTPLRHCTIRSIQYSVFSIQSKQCNLVLTPSTPWLRKGGSLSETKTTDEAKLVSTGLTERSGRHGAEG
jgi:hypothetical protein